ncbi:cerebellin-1-like [Mercenaria mercenaria]|uniref:cerebellin-1-like n=1 Tax=Mercenaria mercenaria TaxID=6596 RepID=UPI00234F7EF2|nr:cerebellin-1-like [Mercenaria mercenaria]
MSNKTSKTSADGRPSPRPVHYVERQNDIISLQAMQIKDLQETVPVQKQSIYDLTEKVDAQDNDKRKSDLKDLKVKVRSHELALERCMKMVKTASAEQHKDKTEGTKKRFVLDTIETVAFEATILGATKLPHSHADNRVVFETVSLNVGSSYHAGNGTFIAPISGIYIFSTSLMMKSNTNDPEMHIVIEKHGVEVAGAYAVYKGYYEHSSVTAAMELQSVDTVFVSVERHDDISFYGVNLISFMGFLLYPF